MANERKERLEQLKEFAEIAELDKLLHLSAERDANVKRVEEIILGILNNTSEASETNPGGLALTRALIEYYDLMTTTNYMEGSKWTDDKMFNAIALGVGEIKLALLQTKDTLAKTAGELEESRKKVQELEAENAKLSAKVDGNYAEHARQRAVEQAQRWNKAYDAEVYRAGLIQGEARAWKLKALENVYALAKVKAELYKSNVEIETLNKRIAALEEQLATIEQRNVDYERLRVAEEQRDNSNKTNEGLRKKLKNTKVRGLVIGGILALGLGISLGFNIAQGAANAHLKEENSDLTQEVERLNGQLETITAEYNAKIETLNEKHAKEIEDLIAEHEEEVAALNAEWEAKVAEITEDYENQIAAIKAEHDAKVAELNEAHAQEIEELNKAHQDEIDNLTKTFTDRVNAIQTELEKLEQYASDLTNDVYTMAQLDWGDVTVEKKDEVSYVTTFSTDAEMTALGEAHYAISLNSTDPVNLEYADFTLEGNAVILEGAKTIIEESMNNQNEHQDDETKGTDGASGVAANQGGAGTQIGGGSGSQNEPVPETDEPATEVEEAEGTNDTAAAELVEYNAAGAAKVVQALNKFEEDFNSGAYIAVNHTDAEVRAKIAEVRNFIAQSTTELDTEKANELIAQAEAEFTELQSWVTAYISYGR